MTLKERFKKLICRNFTINQLEEIADDYAIEFGEWLMKKGRYNINNWSKTTKELLEIFKKEKGL